jgi:DNA modification methylase
VPVVYVSLDEGQERELNLRLNKNTGEFDFDLLANFDADLLADIGWDGEELDAIFGVDTGDGAGDNGKDPDAIPDAPKDPICKLGDMFQLGRHRLLCGDSTDRAVIERLMSGEKADMVFTDPPYGMRLDTNYSSMKNNLKITQEKKLIGGKKYHPVIGDDKDYNPFHIFEMSGNIKEVFLWGADYYSEKIVNKNDGSWIVWDKRLDDSADKMYGSCFELCWSKQKHKRDIVRIKWAGIFGIEQEFDHKRYHPTQKPIGLVEWFLNRYSEDNQSILDLFGGSGSTLIACEKTNRQCRMVELSPEYCDVIIARWEEYTGEKAVKL